uniref:C-type lectin domain-containing protein n=1 Tax=Branchiostoma floridae TaxID=7739 RepID=C3YS46_BRAFL|eukprot:XP_002600939.1 hypothetical protein BRAFLDRAFT_79129 [Branchiostoma floridae]
MGTYSQLPVTAGFVGNQNYGPGAIRQVEMTEQYPGTYGSHDDPANVSHYTEEEDINGPGQASHQSGHDGQPTAEDTDRLDRNGARILENPMYAAGALRQDDGGPSASSFREEETKEESPGTDEFHAYENPDNDVYHCIDDDESTSPRQASQQSGHGGKSAEDTDKTGRNGDLMENPMYAGGVLRQDEGGNNDAGNSCVFPRCFNVTSHRSFVILLVIIAIVVAAVIGAGACLVVFFTTVQETHPPTLNSSLEWNGCPTVVLYGSTAVQVARMTSYTMTGDTREGHPVYYSNATCDFLYYKCGDYLEWCVGPQVGGGSRSVKISDSHLYADGINETFFLWDGRQWRNNSDVKIACSDDVPAGAVVPQPVSNTTDCTRVHLHGDNTYQPSRMTTYTRTNQTSGGRPVYVSDRDSRDFLFFLGDCNQWWVGRTIGKDFGYAYIKDCAMTPDQTRPVWELWHGSGWRFVPSVHATCFAPKKKWRDDARCGPWYPAEDGNPAECDPASGHPCCSRSNWCGNTAAHCDCPDYCVDYRKIEANLALGKSAFQTTTFYGFMVNGFASHAVDGNTNTWYHDGSCTHTAEGKDNPAWWVDLGQSYEIGRVTIFNRQDCCSERINPFNIHIGDSDQVSTNPRCGGDHQMNLNQPSISVSCQGMKGRYVGVRLPGAYRILTLCEVQVQGHSGHPPLVNGFSVRRGDCPGSDISSISGEDGITLEDCAERCTSHADCVAFMFFDNNRCFPKSQTCEDTTKDNLKNVFYDKEKGDGYKQGCKYGYIQHKRHCFRLVSTPMQFWDAQKACVAEGASLAMPKTKGLDRALRRLVKTSGGNADYWIGMVDDGFDWKWVDGKRLGRYQFLGQLPYCKESSWQGYNPSEKLYCDHVTTSLTVYQTFLINSCPNAQSWTRWAYNLMATRKTSTQGRPLPALPDSKLLSPSRQDVDTADRNIEVHDNCENPNSKVCGHLRHTGTQRTELTDIRTYSQLPGPVTAGFVGNQKYGAGALRQVEMQECTILYIETIEQYPDTYGSNDEPADESHYTEDEDTNDPRQASQQSGQLTADLEDADRMGRNGARLLENPMYAAGVLSQNDGGPSSSSFREEETKEESPGTEEFHAYENPDNDGYHYIDDDEITNPRQASQQHGGQPTAEDTDETGRNYTGLLKSPMYREGVLHQDDGEPIKNTPRSKHSEKKTAEDIDKNGRNSTGLLKNPMYVSGVLRQDFGGDSSSNTQQFSGAGWYVKPTSVTIPRHPNRFYTGEQKWKPLGWFSKLYSAFC